MFLLINLRENALALGTSASGNNERGILRASRFQCPISNNDMNGSKPFLGLWRCGHAICESVLRELHAKDKSQTPGKRPCPRKFNVLVVVRSLKI